jgi:hypothetical protein
MITKTQLRSAGAGFNVQIDGFYVHRGYDEKTGQNTRVTEYALVHHSTPGTVPELYALDTQVHPHQVRRIWSGKSSEEKFRDIVNAAHTAPVIAH